jgi:hypothetical protein
MMGYVSLAGVCGLYWLLQKYMGKKTSPSDEGYKDDHGYLPPIDESGVDDMFEHWWEPATRGLDEDITEKSTIKNGYEDEKSSSKDEEAPVAEEESKNEE